MGAPTRTTLKMKPINILKNDESIANKSTIKAYKI
jgi:hypothetical protein